MGVWGFVSSTERMIWKISDSDGLAEMDGIGLRVE